MGEPEAAAAGASAGGGEVTRPARLAAALAAVALVAVAARVPTFRVPLDQDCAVYTYMAQRWAAGEVPYRDVWDHKPPAIYAVYRAVLTVTPDTAPIGDVLRGASCVVDMLTAVAVFFLARRLFGFGAGLLAGLVAAVGLALPDLQFEALQPERLVALFLSVGLLATVVSVDLRCWVCAVMAGLLLGIAAAVKPVAAPACVVAWLWAVWSLWRAGDEGRGRRVVVHTLAMAVAGTVPWSVGALYFASKGAFDDFWFCTFSYNTLYASAHRKGGLLAGIVPLVWKKMNEHGWLWVLAGAGAAVGLLRPATRRGAVLAVGWLCAAFLGVLLPGQLAYYYYVPTVPALATVGGLALWSMWRAVKGPERRLMPAVVLGIVLLGALVQSARSQKRHYQRVCDPRHTNAVAASVAQYIAKTTKPAERLYVWGSRPQLYLLSHRLAATPYLYNYSYRLPLGEAYHFQAEKLEAIMDALREHQPPCIVATETETLDKGFPALRALLNGHYALERKWDAWDGEPYTLRLFRLRGDGAE